MRTTELSLFHLKLLFCSKNSKWANYINCFGDHTIRTPTSCIHIILSLQFKLESGHFISFTKVVFYMWLCPWIFILRLLEASNKTGLRKHLSSVLSISSVSIPVWSEKKLALLPLPSRCFARTDYLRTSNTGTWTINNFSHFWIMILAGWFRHCDSELQGFLFIF